MPKKIIDYSNTSMYKIVCRDLDIKECYVGHTTQMVKRKCAHKNNCKNPNKKLYNVYVYQFIRENGGFDNWSMIEIEKYNGIDRMDVLKRERYWIEQLNAKLNKNIPTRTVKEYNDAHKEEHKLYYNANKERIVKRVMNRMNEKQKEISEYHKQYYKRNKDTIHKKTKCECGGSYSKNSYKGHIQTTKHENYLKTLEKA